LDEMRATSIIIVNDIDSHGIVSEPRVRMADKIDLTTVHALLMYRHGRNTDKDGSRNGVQQGTAGMTT